jgi:hypothetical protein
VSKLSYQCSKYYSEAAATAPGPSLLVTEGANKLAQSARLFNLMFCVSTEHLKLIKVKEELFYIIALYYAGQKVFLCSGQQHYLIWYCSQVKGGGRVRVLCGTSQVGGRKGQNPQKGTGQLQKPPSHRWRNFSLS